MKVKLANAFSGLALGGLVGFMIGLSISQVVGVVLGALTSLLVTFFGLRENQTAKGSYLNPQSKTVISFFCVGCFLFILLGIHIRSRNSLAPSAGYYIEELERLHLDSNQIKSIVLLKRYGISLGKGGGESIQSEPAAQVSGTLFSSPNTVPEQQSIMQRFGQYPLSRLADFLRLQGQAYEQFYNTVDADVSDSTVKKTILLQLIAITYKDEKNSQ